MTKKDNKVEEKKTILTKKNIIIGSSILLVIILIVVGISLFIYFKPKNVLNRKMKKMGEEYYTNYLYDVLKEGREEQEFKKILKKYTDNGIKVNLDTLSTYKDGVYKNDINDKFLNKYKCSEKNTKVIIYPKNPYNIGDFKAEVQLECNL